MKTPIENCPQPDEPIRERAWKAEQGERPTVELATMRESNGRVTHLAIIRKGERYMEDGHSSIKGRAEYCVAKWKWLLLGAPEPDILSFDCNPPTQAALAQNAQGEIDPVALPMDSAPRDGTIVRLLVQFTDHNLDDTLDPVWTIGQNGFDHNGEDEWQFAGWCWSHDHFTSGKGTPVGWLPFHAERARVPAGMVLVPREPTPEMIEAGNAEYEKALLGNRRDVTAAFNRKWSAMLAAAPSQPAESTCNGMPAVESPMSKAQAVMIWPRQMGRTSAQLAALKAALKMYPSRNTHQLQAAKVCAGVARLAETLLAERASEVTRG